VGNVIDFTHGIDDPTLPDNVEFVVDRRGNKTARAYDSYGNVVQTTQFLRMPDGSERTIVSTADYGDPLNPSKPTRVTDPLNRSRMFTYNALG
ncbi:hypothetical protein, partial [Klebsiella pneumoniae]|uniref:hypothetical protein n=1 Tax=Klebsiella pneumoniae TaxID=573 RepID=UPI00200CA75B